MHSLTCEFIFDSKNDNMLNNLILLNVYDLQMYNDNNNCAGDNIKNLVDENYDNKYS